MAVPAHDQRDYEFACKFNLPIKCVVAPKDGSEAESGKAYGEYGVAVNSPLIDGLSSEQAKTAIIEHFETRNLGKRVVNFKLRDWGISRQRYWGADTDGSLQTLRRSTRKTRKFARSPTAGRGNYRRG